MGEGAAALILEDYDHAVARGARIYAEVAGAAMTADAYHITSTHPDGLGAKHAMDRALKDARMRRDDVQHLNAHATSTPVGDISEMRAVADLFGDQLSDLHISATKSSTGHLLGAAGAIEAIASILSIRDQRIPGVINLDEPDPELPSGLQIVRETRDVPLTAAMSNTFGFGGHNATVVFRKL